MKRYILLLLALIMLMQISCDKNTERKNDYKQIRPTVILPPQAATGTDLYVFSDCKGTLAEVKSALFDTTMSDVHLFKMEYREKDVMSFLGSGKFTNYTSNYRGYDCIVYYKGGTIKDKVTYKGSAKTIIYVIKGVGWYRIK